MSDAMQWLQSCGEFLWNDFLRNVAGKGTLLLTAAWAIDRLLLRRRLLGADMLWTVTLLGLLALPLGAAALPRVTLPIWRAPAAIDVPQAPVSSVSEAPIALNDIPAVNEANGTIAAATPSAASVEGSGKTTAVPFTWPSWSAMAAAVYLLGGAMLIGRLAWGAASMARLIRRAAPIREEAWLHALAARKQQLGVGQHVRLLASAETSVPFTAGWRRPAIVVPADLAASAGEATIDATLLHELTHIARGDYPLHLAGKLVEALYWWNPLAWLATARLSAVRESICDGYCCWRMGDCERYGEVLLALAGRLTRRRAGGVGLAMARGSRLGKRLGSLSNLRLVDYSVRGGARMIGMVLAVVFCTLTGSAVLGYQSTENVTVVEIVADLAAVEHSIKSLSGELHLTANYNFVKPGEKLPPKIIIADDAVSSKVVGDFVFDCRVDGSGKIEADLFRTSKTFEGTERVKREKIVSLFDGMRGKWIVATLAENGSELSTFVHYPTSFQRPNLDPLNLATQHVGKAISGLLADGHAKIVQTENVDGRPTVVVEVDPVAVREDYLYQQRFWIDIERRVAVKRESMVQRGEGMPWGLHYRIHCQDYEEATPGIWLPKTVRIWNYHVTSEGQDHLTAMDHVNVKRWEVNASTAEIRIDGPAENGAVEDMPADSAAPSGSTAMAEDDNVDSQLKVIVVDEAGQPIEGAIVRQNHVHIPPGIPADQKQTRIKNENYRTDAAGAATLTWEGESVDLRIWVSRPGRVPLFAIWAPEFQSDGGKIPKEFRFTLKPGTTIGGVVRDEAGKPIAGAKVEVTNLRAMTPIPAGRPPGVRPEPQAWLAEGETAIVTDKEGRWQATNIPSDEELSLSQIAPEMRLPPGAADYPLRLRISHDGFAPYDGGRDQRLDEAPSLPELRSKEAVIVLKAKEDADQGISGKTGALNKTPLPPEQPVDEKEYPNPPRLAYLAWELPPSEDGPMLSKAWNVRGEETDEPLSVGTDEYNGKTYKRQAWNWADDTLTLHAHPLVLWFEDGAPFEYRPTLVAVVDADGKKHWRGNALTRRWEKRLISVAAPEKPFAWPNKINLLIKYPIEATQTIEELTTFSDQPIKVAEGVDWMGRVEADGRFASTLIIWRKPQDEDLTSYGAMLVAKEGAPIRNDGGGVTRTFDDRQEQDEWYAGLRPEEIARVKIRRQRHATATIEDVPLRLDLMPRE